MQVPLIDAADRWMVASYDFEGYIASKGYDGLAGNVRQSMKQQLSKDPTPESVCDAVEAILKNDDDLVDWLYNHGVARTDLALMRKARRTFAEYLVEKDP